MIGKIEDGKIFYYKSRISDINISYQNNSISIELIRKN